MLELKMSDYCNTLFKQLETVMKVERKDSLQPEESKLSSTELKEKVDEFLTSNMEDLEIAWKSDKTMLDYWCKNFADEIGMDREIVKKAVRLVLIKKKTYNNKKREDEKKKREDEKKKRENEDRMKIKRDQCLKLVELLDKMGIEGKVIGMKYDNEIKDLQQANTKINDRQKDLRKEILKNPIIESSKKEQLLETLGENTSVKSWSTVKYWLGIKNIGKRTHRRDCLFRRTSHTCSIRKSARLR
eukprot:TRINITY_DN1871_c0_g1_i3.p1 TRINITY_DN1871_c0_g1~~TRINITY_DN1871_c0_g1_i3.p1  ORF type:complete len:244 (-),score=36.31 TRINITY_DN1871_c0_g1_i3:1617-2348(-)